MQPKSLQALYWLYLILLACHNFILAWRGVAWRSVVLRSEASSQFFITILARFPSVWILNSIVYGFEPETCSWEVVLGLELTCLKLNLFGQLMMRPFVFFID